MRLLPGRFKARLSGTDIVTKTDMPAFKWQRLRLPALVVVLAGLYVLARQSGLLDDVDPRRIRAIVEQWGLYSVILYVVLFSIGLFLYVPGTLFIIAAGLAYGKLWGVPIALLGVNIAINVSFLTVRLIGGTPFEQHSHPFVGKLLKGLHASPVTNIAIMRLVFWTAPGLNYLLALSAVKPQQHFLGSLVGTIIPVTVMVYFTDWLMLKIFQ